jgi:hypothetical protein
MNLLGQRSCVIGGINYKGLTLQIEDIIPDYISLVPKAQKQLTARIFLF